MKINRATKKEFLKRVTSEISNRVGIDLTKDEVWSIFCVMFCTMFQMTFDFKKLTLNNWISFSIEPSSRKKAPVIRPRISSPAQNLIATDNPNFFLSLLDSTHYNIVMSDLEDDRVVEQES